MLKSTLQQTDPEIYNIIQEEAERQEYGIELIASENYTSKAVMEAMGSVLTNKYSEGYVGKRYYIPSPLQLSRPFGLSFSLRNGQDKWRFFPEHSSGCAI